jgi:hypothetical protein
VDDNSSENHKKINENLAKNYNYIYIYNDERKGIAGSKNNCLKNLIDCKEVFLFDDDCFPRNNDWDVPFISLVSEGIEHSSYCVLLDEPHNKKIIDSDNYFVINNGQGMCLFFTRKCLDTIGFYDENYGIYGYEHSDMSYRAKKAGFCKEYTLPYITPKNAHNFIYCLDLDYRWKNQLTELGPFTFEFKSSIAKEEPFNEYIKKSEKNFNSKHF